MNTNNIPELTLGGLDRYVNNKIAPGGFLTAVLCNDLFGAFAKADNWNQAAMFDICRYIYNDLPSVCWGSKEKMEAWLNTK